MKRFLTDLAAAVKHLSKRRQGPRREPRAQLGVEGMEERLALSASPLGFQGPVLPDRPVHGYKWRRPPWWPYAVTTAGDPTRLSPGIVVLGQTPPPPAAVHLAFGGADGSTGVTAAGHIVVTPPGGPLPSE
jgi:hypothetical protein